MQGYDGAPGRVSGFHTTAQGEGCPRVARGGQCGSGVPPSSLQQELGPKASAGSLLRSPSLILAGSVLYEQWAKRPSSK